MISTPNTFVKDKMVRYEQILSGSNLAELMVRRESGGFVFEVMEWHVELAGRGGVSGVGRRILHQAYAAETEAISRLNDYLETFR